MRRSRPALALFGTLALFFIPPATAAGGVSAAFAKTSDWGSGYQAQYTITNGSSATITSWKVEFDLPAGCTVGSYWDALLTQSSTHYTFTNRRLQREPSRPARARSSAGSTPGRCTVELQAQRRIL